MCKHRGTASRRDKQVRLAAISPPGAARDCFARDHQSGLAEWEPPPLLMRGASSCPPQGQRQGEPWGASPQPSAPTYLPTSGSFSHLRVCAKYWSAQDSAWMKHWGPHQGLMWMHCPRVDIPRAVAEIRKAPSKAVFVVPMGCNEEERTRDRVASLNNMTLNKVVLPAGESVHQDARGQPMPPQRWLTDFHYVDEGRQQADATDFVCVNRVIAEAWRQRFAASPVDIGESKNLLSDEELHLVQGYMDRHLHDSVGQEEGKRQEKAWWDVDAIVFGSYDGNTFGRRVLDQMSSQDEPTGGNPPAYGDLFRGKARDRPMGHVGRPRERKLSGIATPEVSSVVQMPGKAKA